MARFSTFLNRNLETLGKRPGLALHILLLLILLDVGWWGVTHPFMRLYENAVCRAHFLEVDPSKVLANGFVEEKECKIAVVQSALGSLNGWWALFESFSGLTVANYFGRVADRRGRKFVFSLNLGIFLFSYVLQYLICINYHLFPDPRELWLTTIPYFIGGGPKMLSPMLMVMLSDLVDEEKRTKIFMVISAVQLSCELIGSETGSFLLQKNVNLSMWFGVLFAILLVIGTIFLPETLSLSPKLGNVSAVAYQPAPSIELDSYENNDDHSSDDEDQQDGSLLRRQLSRDRSVAGRAVGLFNMGRFFLPNRTLIPLGIAFYAYYFDSYLAYYAIQWVSLKYHWTISKTGRILPSLAAFKLINLLVIFPFLSKRIRSKFGWTAIYTEITLTRTACAALAFGSFFIGSTPPYWPWLILGLLASSFGACLQPLLRSLMVTLVRPDQVGQLMAGITIIQTLCSTTVGPTYAQALDIGLRIDILGLPFYLDSALQVIALTCLLTSIQHNEFLKQS